MGLTRSFGDVVSMSGLPEGGPGWAIQSTRPHEIDVFFGEHVPSSRLRFQQLLAARRKQSSSVVPKVALGGLSNE
jgi:hypothetical protein